jgi:hypothetical protein
MFTRNGDRAKRRRVDQKNNRIRKIAQLQKQKRAKQMAVVQKLTKKM